MKATTVSTHARVLRLVQLALLAALEIVLTVVVIQVGTINLNFGLTPIIIAAVVLGPVAGTVIGAISGIVTMIQVLTGQSAFYLFLVATNPVAASLLCVLKTAVAGLLAGLAYKLICKVSKYKTLNAVIPAAVCPIVNTGIFALGMLTIFGGAMMSDPTISSWAQGSGLIALVFVVLIGINFFVELALNVVVCPLICKALFASKIIKEAQN